MSSIRSLRDFSFWEYVHCAVCQLPFIPDPVNAPTAPPCTPFWLTECGHTLCNGHLSLVISSLVWFGEVNVIISMQSQTRVVQHAEQRPSNSFLFRKRQESLVICHIYLLAQCVLLFIKMTPPMSDWFRPIPQVLDTIAAAARFQQEMMASRLHYYKRKCGQYRAIAKRVEEAEMSNKTLRRYVYFTSPILDETKSVDLQSSRGITTED